MNRTSNLDYTPARQRVAVIHITEYLNSTRENLFLRSKYNSITTTKIVVRKSYYVNNLTMTRTKFIIYLIAETPTTLTLRVKLKTFRVENM